VLSRRPRVGLHPALLIFLGALWFTSAFGGGYLLGQANALAGNFTLTDRALQALAKVGIRPVVNHPSVEATLSPDEQARFKVFWEAWTYLNREFYNRSALDPQKMTYGAVKGLVESLGDPNTAFSAPRENQISESHLRGTFSGVGIQMDFRDNRFQVVAPIEGSPAEKAGLRAGDVVQKVDGQELRGKSLNDVVLLIRGPRGTSVTLTILRPGEPEPFEVSIERAEIKTESVRSRLLENDLGYLRISSFSATTGADTSAAVKKLLDQNVRGFVVDLRANPGGYVTAAVDVTSQFLSDAVVLYQQTASGSQQIYRTKPGGAATSIPVVVLIDKGSASASEIVAAALRDNGRAVLVGEPSYGKGTVQSVHTLSDASGLRVTSAIWLTSAGQPLEKQGLTPDLVVSRADDQAGQDAQLDAAVRHLQRTAEASGPPAGV
jgi:carboxyl-terminal processing protease